MENKMRANTLHNTLFPQISTCSPISELLARESRISSLSQYSSNQETRRLPPRQPSIEEQYIFIFNTNSLNRELQSVITISTDVKPWTYLVSRFLISILFLCAMFRASPGQSRRSKLPSKV